jgi:hypothetical protein
MDFLKRIYIWLYSLGPSTLTTAGSAFSVACYHAHKYPIVKKQFLLGLVAQTNFMGYLVELYIALDLKK